MFRRSSEDSSRWHIDEQPPEHLACLASTVGKGSLNWRGGPKSMILYLVETPTSCEVRCARDLWILGQGTEAERAL